MSDATTDRPPFPFIVGVGRSGTTMLRAMLDSHPDLCVPGESHFLTSLLRPWRRRGLENDRRVDPDRLLAALGPNRLRKWGLDPDAVRVTFEQPPDPDLAEAVRRLYGLHATAAGKPRYGDKTPSYVSSIGPIARLLPESRFVHLVRDGRDVALSQLDLGEWGATSVDAAATGWVREIRNGRRAGTRLGDDRYLEVRYEELVGAPEETLRTICGFLELPWTVAVLDYTGRADQVLRDVALPSNQQGIRSAPTQGMRSWETQMDDADVARYECIAGPDLVRYGYPIRHGFSLRQRAEGTWRRAAVAARRDLDLVTTVAKRFRR